MNKLIKTFLITLVLISLPVRILAQEKIQIRDYENGFLFNIFQIENVEERVQLASALATSNIWICNPTDNPGELFIRPNGFHADIPIYAEFDYLRTILRDEYQEASSLPKEEFTEIYNSWAQNISTDYYNFLISDYVGDRANHCMDAEPFCTTDVYNFPALNSGYSWAGPNYGCLNNSPTSKHSFWYYMRVGVAGNITIKIEASFDVDFALWGPFTNETDPCPTAAGQAGMLTANCTSCPNNTTNPSFYPSGNLHDCSYDAAHFEYAHVVNGQVGQYYILLITNFSGSSGSITFQKYSGNGETDCGIMPPLVSNTGPYCVGETISLTGNGQAGASYSWSGPGGWTATGQTVTRPNCTLDMAGTYTCTITVGSQSNSATTQVEIHNPPTANFTASTVCKGTPTQFTNTSTSNPPNQQLTYLWNFGDGNTSNQANPSHQYASAGDFTVSLTAMTGNASCSSTKTQTVTVYAPPTPNAGEDQSIPYGSTAVLSGSGGSGGTFTYHWEPASLVVNANAQTTQTVPLQQSTTFTLTVVNSQGGCSGTDQVNIVISGSNMTATASASPTSICPGGSSQLNATASGGTGNYTYSWSPTLGLSAPNIANPIASPTTTTTYSCVVSDGLSTQTVSTTVTVNSTEYEELTQYICPDESYTFYGEEYTEEGDYEYTTTTPQGCEKVITLHLHHYPTYEDAPSEVHICFGDIYHFHGHQYNTSGLYSETLETIHGCDSIVWLNLTVYPANDTTLIDPSICESQSYNFHGTYYSHNGDMAYFDTIDEHGCLKVEKLVLSVGAYQMPPTEEVFWCVPHGDTPSYTWPRNNVTYTQDTEDEVILPDPNGGCDFKYRLNLKFHQVYYRTETQVVCDSYEWDYTPGIPYTSTNHHIEKNFGGGGGPNFNCDSIYVLDLTVYNSNESEITKTNQCDSLRWHFGNNGESYLYTQSGDYTRTIHTTHGCDSTVTLHLTMDYRPDFDRVEGNPWVVGGSEFQYTIESYWIETDPQSTHSTEWGLYDIHGAPFNKWDLVPYDNGDKCMLYIYTFERDSVELRVQTQSTGSCDCGSYSDSKWIHCGYINVDETPSLCEADIYPNPNDGSMTLSFDNMVGEVEIKVYNINGTLIDRFTVYNGFTHQTHSYQTERLSGGVYFFNLAGKDVSITKKVIIID